MAVDFAADSEKREDRAAIQIRDFGVLGVPRFAHSMTLFLILNVEFSSGIFRNNMIGIIVHGCFICLIWYMLP